MEQHPVPQHIASFEFKLFGNLTLRQFVTLAIPMSFAIAIFFSNITPIVRIPISVVIAIFGFFIALVPINGKSFDKWIVSFAKAIMSPTQRIWIKEEKLPEFLSVVTSLSAPQETLDTATSQTPNRQQLLAYVNSLPKQNQNPLDKREQIAVQQLGLEVPVVNSMQSNQTVAPPIFLPQKQAENVTPHQKNRQQSTQPPKTQMQDQYEGRLKDSLPKITISKTSAAAKSINPHSKIFILPGTEDKITEKPQIIKESSRPKAHLAANSSYSLEKIISFKSPDRRISFIPIIGSTRVRKLHFGPPPNPADTMAVKGEKTFNISKDLKQRFPDAKEVSPKQEPKKTLNASGNFRQSFPDDKNVAPKHELEANTQDKAVNQAHNTRAKNLIVASNPMKLDGHKTAERQENKTVSQKAPAFKSPQINISKKTYNQADKSSPPSIAQMMPITDKPNILSGVVNDQNGNIVEGAIITVHDQNGIPVRALKSNKLGQFLSATSLSDGKFTLDIEGGQLAFSPITLNLNSQVMSPIELKAKGPKA